MGLSSLGSRAIIGEFYSRLDQDLGQSWVDQISNRFTSDQESETYKWLGQVPQMRKWKGQRLIRGLRDFGITLVNEKYESTMEVFRDELRRDKTDQIEARIAEQVERANSHWAKLLTTQIEAGESSVAYDGQFFFDTDHSEGDSGTQSNDITYDVTTTTAPTAGEMQSAILAATAALMGIKDDQGEPYNENARRFLVMVPTPFMGAAAAALGSTVLVENATSVASNNLMTLGTLGGFRYDLAINPRLTWTTKFSVFRTDSAIKSLIRQEEEEIVMDSLEEGSDVAFFEDKYLYGIKASRAVGFGQWQRAILVTLT